MSDDFDDLMAEPVRRKRGRPSNEERARRAEETLQQAAATAEIRRAGMGQAKIDPNELKFLPVSQNWLATFFDMDPMTVKKRLQFSACKPAGSVGGGRPVYVFQDAVPYIIKPKMDIGTYIKTLNAADLPNSINKVFWEAERIKNKTLIETGEAWATEKVLEVLGEVFMTVKDRIPLIQDAMTDLGCTTPQMNKLREMCDQFQKDVHEALVEMPKRRRTPSRVSEVDPGDSFDDDDGEFGE